jgi:hypothetical protein
MTILTTFPCRKFIDMNIYRVFSGTALSKRLCITNEGKVVLHMTSIYNSITIILKSIIPEFNLLK